MDFYEILSTFYDEIFPVSNNEIQFVLEHLPSKKVPILDVGCATGEMAISLSEKGYPVEGCDLDEQMILQGKEKGEKEGQDIGFMVLDMRQLHKKYKENYFGGILCTGNTLVHLNSLQEMKNVLSQMYELLQDEGKIIIQIVNYDRILNKNIKSLPLIQTENIRFERRYQYDSMNHKVFFLTELQVNYQGKQDTYVNSIPLHPLRFEELHGMMKEIGFEEIKAYGNFKGELYHQDSYAMIMTASK